MMAGLEIKVLEPLFAIKVRFWVGVPLPPIATGGMFASKSKKSYQMSAGVWLKWNCCA